MNHKPEFSHSHKMYILCYLFGGLFTTYRPTYQPTFFVHKLVKSQHFHIPKLEKGTPDGLSIPV